MNVVITQPMLFPWVGMLEQIRLADIVVIYSDVQFSKGSFVNRVQVKTNVGKKWMTVPLRDLRFGEVIDQVKIDSPAKWVPLHLSLLGRAFNSTPYAECALRLANDVYSSDYKSIGDLSCASMVAIADYFGILAGKKIIYSRELGVGGAGSERVLEIVKAVGGTNYITGHGARNYLDHEAFERAGIQVNYMVYNCHPYPQIGDDFTPFVTSLDLLANVGLEGERFISSGFVYWRKFLSPV